MCEIASEIDSHVCNSIQPFRVGAVLRIQNYYLGPFPQSR